MPKLLSHLISSMASYSNFSPNVRLNIVSRLAKDLPLHSRGFTLVELMIVVAIIGVLSSVALPQFLNARDRADAKAKVGELVGLAKECAAFNAESDITPTTVKAVWGLTTTCGGSSPSSVTLTSRTWKTSLAVTCLGATVTGTSIKVSVTPQGQMSCTL